MAQDIPAGLHAQKHKFFPFSAEVYIAALLLNLALKAPLPSWSM